MDSADALHLEILRRKSPAEKLAIAAQLRDVNLDLVAAGLRSRDGGLSAEALRREVLKRVLPERLYRAAYPPL